MNPYNIFREELANCRYVDGQSEIIESLIEFRTNLLELGYEPIPVQGKSGLHAGWTGGEITLERIETETRFGTQKLNTGIRTGRLVGVDIDLRNLEHSAEISKVVQEKLGPSPLRRRGAKGEMICYYNPNPIPKIVVSPNDSSTTLVEIFGTDRQFVAYGRHPEGMWYEWAGEAEPATTPLVELPHTDPEQLYDLEAAIRIKLEDLGYELKPKRDSRTDQPKSYRINTNDDEDVTDLCRAALQVIPNDLDREEWINVACACHDAGLDLSDFREFSNRWGGTHKPGAIEAAWSSCSNPRAITFRKLLGLADDADPDWRKRYYEPIREARRRSYEEWEQEQLEDMKETFRREAAEEEVEEPIIDDEVVAQEQEREAPFDLFGTLTPEPRFDRTTIPKKIADLAFDAAERIGIDASMVAMFCLGACCIAIDDGIKIQVKALDTSWTESARLWFGAVGPSGMVKTAAFDTAVDPLHQVQNGWIKEDARALREYQLEEEVYKSHEKQYKKDYVAAVDGGHALPEPPEQPEAPPKRRLITTDPTMEALAEILVDNPRGIGIVSDELMSFIGGFDAYRSNGSKRDKPTALKLFDGKPRPIDRVKGTLLVPNWSACVIGGIQDDKLREQAKYLAGDGMLQRFILFRANTHGMTLDRPNNAAAEHTYNGLISLLAHLGPRSDPIVLSEGAQAYREEIEKYTFAIRTTPTLPSALRSHISKLHGIFARLLLVYHLVECAPILQNIAVVSEDTAERVYRLMMDFIIPNAVEIYTSYFLTSDEANSDARWIADYIISHASTEMNLRTLRNGNKSRFDDKGRAVAAMELLTVGNWVTLSDENKWKVNPQVHVVFAERAKREARRRDEVKRSICRNAKIIRNARK